MIIVQATPSCSARGADTLLQDVLALYWQAERSILAIEAVPEPLVTATQYPAWESKFDALVAERDQAISQLADIRAMTPEGKQAKAQVLERCLLPRLRFPDPALDDPEIRLALSLARDVAGGVA